MKKIKEAILTNRDEILGMLGILFFGCSLFTPVLVTEQLVSRWAAAILALALISVGIMLYVSSLSHMLLKKGK